jgi:acyl-CoA thioesterase FadM
MNPPVVERLAIRYQDLDPYGHVNNAVYLEFFEEGTLAAEGSAAQVFFDPKIGEVQPRPEWFLPAVAKLEGRPEESFSPVAR